MTQLPMIQSTSDFFEIDPNNYIPSLLEKGIQANLITQSEADITHACILNLLAENILLISEGRSTSVKEETAQKMLRDIFFHMENALKKSPTPGAALLRLKHEGAIRIYKEGLSMANQAFDEACEIWSILNKSLQNGMNIHYKQFIIGTLSSYLGNYNHRFEPKTELSISLSANGIHRSLTGIFEVLAFEKELLSHTQ